MDRRNFVERFSAGFVFVRTNRFERESVAKEVVNRLQKTDEAVAEVSWFELEHGDRSATDYFEGEGRIKRLEWRPISR